jgi:hypothetical protein
MHRTPPTTFHNVKRDPFEQATGLSLKSAFAIGGSLAAPSKPSAYRVRSSPSSASAGRLVEDNLDDTFDLDLEKEFLRTQSVPSRAGFCHSRQAIHHREWQGAVKRGNLCSEALSEWDEPGCSLSGSR